MQGREKERKRTLEERWMMRTDIVAVPLFRCPERYKHGHHTSRPTRRTTRPLEARFPTCTS